MRARLVDSHVRVRVDGAPGLEVEGELEPLALGERGVGYPDAQPPAAEPLDTAAGALEEGDEVAGAPRVVELDLHGPQLRRAARRRWTHRGGRTPRAKLTGGAGLPPRTGGNASAALAGVGIACFLLGFLAVQAGPAARERIIALSFAAGIVLLLAHGAVRAHRRAVNAAVHRERRRIARELHDGLAQELAFVVTQCSRLPSEPRIGTIAEAAQSALAEARRAMVALRRPAEAPLAEELEEVARHAADRAGLRLELRLAEGVELPAAARVELARILQEAIVNTARHARATGVHVELACEDGTRLTISDDGVGFDPGRPAAVSGGFGIVGMRERVKQLGGELRIVSAPRHGTRVEVHLP